MTKRNHAHLISHYPHLLDPTVHPDYLRRHVRVPTWETFENTTQFATLRGFREERNALVGFTEELDDYTKRFRLGRVVWPFFSTVFTRNFRELVQEIKRRGLYLFDIWGHVPGSGTEAAWGHVMPPEGVVEYLRQTLGDRFLGFDNGEQDGRYIGGYAHQQCPAPQDRFRQYLNFQHHFERLCDDLGNQMSALVSLCFGHYFLKEGNHLLIGAETAQALPNSQVYYAFIRGAGKQYGIHWFGNASVWNRWGFKNYAGEGDADGCPYGPAQGTSLSLLKRLLYTHYLYNSVAVGFESGWIVTEEGGKRLSPIGEIQAAAVRFVEEHGQPGVMHAPVALLLDHFAGWAMPRHLYTDKVYQVWGGMPYDDGDYLTHAALSLFYPGYEDASYFRDERGFLSPTPYGDVTDCLLSDAPHWVLRQYGLIIVASRLDPSAAMEVRDNLERFVEAGGHLVVTAENARMLWPEWGVGPARRIPPGATIRRWDGTQTIESRAFDLCDISPPEGAQALAVCDDAPAAIRIERGGGRITLFLTPFGLNAEPFFSGPIENEPEKTLACPYALLNHVGGLLDEAVREHRLFSVGVGLSYVTCRKGGGDYLIGVQNNGLSSLPVGIESHCGPISEVAELPLDQSEKGAVGYRPKGVVEDVESDEGTSADQVIAGGDVRLFRVRVEEANVRLIPSVQPPPRPRNRILAIPPMPDIETAILRLPTFFQHFDGVKTDWRYLRDRDRTLIEREKGWLSRQKVRIVVDLSSGLNFYPDLTLLDTLDFRYRESVAEIDDVLTKMELIGARDAVISLHRKPENHCSDARADRRFLVGMKRLCRRAYRRGVTLYLQHHPHKWHGSIEKTLSFISDVGAPNLKYALNLGHIAASDEPFSQDLADARLGAVLVCAPRRDLFGQYYDAHLRIAGSDLDLTPVRNIPDGTLVILDADYGDWNATYADVRAVERAVEGH